MADDPQGTIALVGAGEYLPEMEPVDRLLLDRVSGSLRVVVLPTAAAPDGKPVAERWARMGVEHFTRLGVYVEPVMLLTRADAQSAELAGQIGAASFVYLSGGKPGYLVATLRGTPCWESIRQVYRRGGVVAGCSAGAMALASVLPGLRARPALGLTGTLCVIPHANEIPRWMPRALGLARRKAPIAAVDGMTALMGTPSGWVVAGSGRVTLLSGGRATRYVAGQAVPLPIASPRVGVGS
ncbi:MAG TPA: Type 1 glutamine amidotransferase-like domain-containing protein [Ktedonobacterales bacterium]